MANGEADTKSGKGNWSNVANFGTQQVGDNSYTMGPGSYKDGDEAKPNGNAKGNGQAYKFPGHGNGGMGTEGGASVFGVYSNSLQGGPMVGSVGCSVDVEKVLRYVMGEKKAAELADEQAKKDAANTGAPQGPAAVDPADAAMKYFAGLNDADFTARLQDLQNRRTQRGP